MTEAQPNPEAQNPEPVAPGPETNTPAAVEPTAPKATDNALAAKLRKAEKAQANLQAKLDELAEKNKTEEEKKLDEAYKRGKSETEAQVLKVRIEGRAEAAMARFGIPPELLPSVLSEISEVEDPAEVPAAIEKLTKDKPAVYGIHAEGPKPTPPVGAPSHATVNSFLDGPISREQIQEAITKGGGTLDPETIKKIHAASIQGRVTG